MGGRGARGESCPSGKRHGSAAFAEDDTPSSNPKSFHDSTTTPTNREQKRWSLGSIPPGAVWNPQPHWLIADWLRIVEAPPPGEDKTPPPDQKSFHTPIPPTNRERTRWFTGSIPPRTVWKPQPHWQIADWLGFVEPAASREDRIPSTDNKFFRTSATPTNRGRKRWPSGSVPPHTAWKSPNPTD